MHAIRLLTVLLVSLFSSTTASAQVFDSGPSAPALFTNVINMPGDALPAPIGGVMGQTIQVNLYIGSRLVDFLVTDSGTEFNITGGSVDSVLEAKYGSEVNISGGDVLDLFANSGSLVNISGGTVDGIFLALSGSIVNISGGSVDFLLNADDGSEVNISGGTLGGFFSANSGSKVNLFGSDFVLGGVPLNDLVQGQAFTIFDRNTTLAGLLDDGSAFGMNLGTNSQNGDQFASDATLTVTLTPRPLGDVSQDGVVNALDIAPFISILFNYEYLATADINEDGVVDFGDIGPFIVLLSPQV